MKQEYFYALLGGILVYRMVTLGINFAGTHLYIWVKKGTMRVRCFSKNKTQ